MDEDLKKELYEWIDTYTEWVLELAHAKDKPDVLDLEEEVDEIIYIVNKYKKK